MEQLQGAAVPASALESLVLPARVADYAPAMLDELCAAGEVVWVGAGPLGRDDGKVMLFLRGTAPLLRPLPVEGAARPAGAEHDRHRAKQRHGSPWVRSQRCDPLPGTGS